MPAGKISERPEKLSISSHLKVYVEFLAINLREADSFNSVESCLWNFCSLIGLHVYEQGRMTNVDNVESNSKILSLMQLSTDCRIAAELTDPDAPHVTTIQEAFYNSPLFDSIADSLLHDVVPRWLPSFSVQQKRYLLDPIFMEAQLVTVLSLLVPSLSRTSESKASQKLSERLLVRCFFEKRSNGQTGLHKLAMEASHKWSNNPATVSGLLASIPDRCQPSSPSVLKSPLFFQNCLTEILAGSSEWWAIQTRMEASTSLLSSNLGPILLLSSIITKLCRRGHADIVASVVVTNVLPRAAKATDESQDSFWHHVVQNTQDRHAEQRWVEALVKEMVGRELCRSAGLHLLNFLFGKSVLENASIRYIFTDRFLLQSCLPKYALNWIVPFAFFNSPTSAGIDRAEQKLIIAAQVAQLWSTREFVRNATHEQQEYVTRALVLILRSFSRKDIESTKGLLPALLSGVSVRLDSPLLPIRRCAQKVALAFSTAMDPQNPLIFDELQEEADSDDEAAADQPPSISDPVTELDQSRDVLFEESSRPSIEDDVDSLQPYNLEDDLDSDFEPDGDKKTPVQLRECVVALRKTDDPDMVEKAVKTAELLIRSKPDELADVAIELAQALVHVQCSQVAVEGEEDSLEAARQLALVALLVECTGPSLSVLTRVVFSPHVDTSQRIMAMAAMADAARQLANYSVSLSEKEGSLTQREFLISEVSGGPGSHGRPWNSPGESSGEPWKEVMAPVVHSGGSGALLSWSHRYERSVPLKNGTTRLGKPRAPDSRLSPSSRSSTPAVCTENRFGKWAAGFMLPLMREFDSVKQGVDWVNRDWTVLSHFLSLMGTCMECLRGQPQVQTLAPLLLDLLQARSICLHEEASVRRGALHAAAHLMLALPPASVVADIAAGGGQAGMTAGLVWVREWCSVVRDTDPDYNCSAMAAACLRIHQHLWEKSSLLLSEDNGGSDALNRSSERKKRGPLIVQL